MHKLKQSRAGACDPDDDLRRKQERRHDHLVDHGAGLFSFVRHHDTGAWNYSFAALQRTRECVIAIPTVDLLDRVVGVGTCSGADKVR